MNLGEEQRLMRERNSPKGSRSTNRPSVKPEDPSTGYLDQKTADERYKSRQTYNSVTGGIGGRVEAPISEGADDTVRFETTSSSVERR